MTTMPTNLITFTDTATGWQRDFYAFLAEKEQHSGSRRTVEGYARILQDFFGRSGKQPDNVSPQDIFVYAHSPGLSGKQPSVITIGARLACLSSFFRFLIRVDIVQSNPCDRLQRPQVSNCVCKDVFSVPDYLCHFAIRRLKFSSFHLASNTLHLSTMFKPSDSLIFLFFRCHSTL